MPLEVILHILPDFVEYGTFTGNEWGYSMWKQQVGSRVHQIRRERNLSRAEFGKLIGKSEQYVGRVERGNAAITGDTVHKICETTGVTADYIIRGATDPLMEVTQLNDLSHDQIQVILDIAAGVIKFISTDDGNNALLREAHRRSQLRVIG
jgi:transcriptional regulator with XRE-family HTH domain